MSGLLDLASRFPQAAGTGIVLGECAFAKVGFSRLKPLLRLGPEGWERIADAASAYPDEGRVFCPESRTFDAPQGSLWVFAVEPNLRLDAGGKTHDRIVARDAHPAMRVIDLSNGSWEEARQRVVEVGLPASLGVFDAAYILLSGGTCVRLRFEFDDAGGTQRARLDELTELPILRCGLPMSAGASVEGKAYLIPGTEPHEVIETVDWRPDDEFFSKVLRRIKRAGFGDAGKLTNTAIDALTSFVKARGMLPNEDASLRRMRRRLETFLPQFNPSDNNLEAMVAAVEAHRPVAERLKQILTEQHVVLQKGLQERLEVEIRARLEVEHAAASARVEAALEEAAAAETMRLDAVTQAETVRAEAAALEEALVQEIGGLREALAAVPASAASRAEAIARAASAALGGARGSRELLPSASPPWAQVATGAATIIGHADLAGCLSRAAVAAGVQGADLANLDPLLRAGEVVVLFGGAALLSAYSRCVSAGRLVRFALDPSVIGLDDLWRQPGTGTPTPFAHAWTSALSRPSTSVLLVLDAFNATPFEFWLPSLAEALRGADRPRNLLVGATATTTRCMGRMTVEDFARSAMPFAPSLPLDPRRSALREVGRSSPDEVAAYDGSGAPTPQADKLVAFVSQLEGLDLCDAAAASRAARVFLAASATCSSDEAVSLALDVAGLACGSKARTGSPLALGFEMLQGLMSRGQH